MRVFLALLPSTEALDQMEKWQYDFRHHAPHCRVVPRENLHLTLLFDGNADRNGQKRILEAGESLTHQIDQDKVHFLDPCLSLDSRSVPGLGILTFSGTDDEQSIWREIRSFLATYAQQKKFWPHITLFRQFFPEIPGLTSLPPVHSFGFSQLVLFESILHSEGAFYRTLYSWNLAKLSGQNEEKESI